MASWLHVSWSSSKGLREALRKLGEPSDQYQWMSELVEVTHDGQALGGSNPRRACVKKFFDRVDELKKSGKPWYPGASLSKLAGRLALTEKELVEEVRVTPFVAKKLLKARGMLLAGVLSF